ncbi:hypothetical protein UGMREWDR_CDS0266 [Aeromonas phage GomatiRiver_11]|nr:hypothetical protein UGMREWDR_CDS0266 [Aeromonas phage GomatiRiver_11]
MIDLCWQANTRFARDFVLIIFLGQKFLICFKPQNK